MKLNILLLYYCLIYSVLWVMVDFCWNSVSYLYWEIFWSIYVQALRFWELFGVSSPIFKPQCWPSQGRFSAPCMTGWNQGLATVFSSGTQNLLWADACCWENSAVCGHGIVVSFFLLAFSWVPLSAPRACLRSLPCGLSRGPSSKCASWGTVPQTESQSSET